MKPIGYQIKKKNDYTKKTLVILIINKELA